MGMSADHQPCAVNARISETNVATVDLADLGPYLRDRDRVPCAWVLGERDERVESFVGSWLRVIDRCGQLDHRRLAVHRPRL